MIFDIYLVLEPVELFAAVTLFLSFFSVLLNQLAHWNHM